MANGNITVSMKMSPRQAGKLYMEREQLINEVAELKKENEKLKNRLRFDCSIIHNMVVANQSAWLEWQEGEGAEKAMVWLHNGLVGPGHIPDNEDKKTPQEWFDSNILDQLDNSQH